MATEELVLNFICPDSYGIFSLRGLGSLAWHTSSEGNFFSKRSGCLILIMTSLSFLMKPKILFSANVYCSACHADEGSIYPSSACLPRCCMFDCTAEYAATKKQRRFRKLYILKLMNLKKLFQHFKLKLYLVKKLIA
jgi:hypothetical protein